MRISKQTIERIFQELGYDINNFEERCLGKSLGLVYYHIGLAMKEPNTKFKIHDHYGTITTDRELTRKINEKLLKDNLKYFEIDYSQNTIIYKPYYIFEE